MRMSACALSLLPLLGRSRRALCSRHCNRLSPKKCHINRSPCLGRNRYAAATIMCTQVKVEDDVDDGTCELVNRVDLTIGDDQDGIRAYLLTALKNNNGKGLLLLSDIFGFEDTATSDFAYRVACNGYNVLVPDLFRGNPWKKDQPISELNPWLAQHSSTVSKDIDTATNWLTEEFAAAGVSNKLGLIGFCFGGGKLIETLSRDNQEIFATGVCFYGTRINTSLSEKINVPILFISGDKDEMCAVDTLEEMEKRVFGSRVVVYYGRGHGFVHRPKSQEEDEDAEDAFGIMRSWLQDKLVSSDNVL